MSKFALSLLLLAVLLTACLPIESTAAPPTPSAVATPTRTAERIQVAIVYTRSRNDDPDLYLRAGFYHQMRLDGYYRGDGTLSVLEFPLQVEPRTTDEELTALIEQTKAELERSSFEALITVGPLASTRIAPAYAEHHVTTPVFYAAVPVELAGQLRRYPSIIGLPHERHPVQTLSLARAMMPEPPSRVLILGSGAEAVDATQIYYQLHEAFPEIDFSLYTTERFLIWQETLAKAEDEADAVLLISWEGLRDEQWQLVPADQVLDWTVLHSSIPLFALDERAVRRGAAGGLVASSWETGKAMARLVEAVVGGGAHPSSLSPTKRAVNTLAINLRGVSQWNLDVPTAVALTAVIFTGFPEAKPDIDETP